MRVSINRIKQPLYLLIRRSSVLILSTCGIAILKLMPLHNLLFTPKLIIRRNSSIRVELFGEI